MTNLKKERAIAEAAKRLPWYTKKHAYSIYSRGAKEGDEATSEIVVAEVAIQHYGHAKRQYNLQYIAMANPKRYLELLDTIEAMRCCGNCFHYRDKASQRCMEEFNIDTWGNEVCDDWQPRGEKG